MNSLLWLALVLTLNGCGLFGSAKEEQPPPPPTRVELNIEAAPDINPDSEGRSSPLLLRIYELKGLSAFNGADFFSLYEKEQTALAGDMVRKEEFILKPGEKRELVLTPGADTGFVATFAAFRNLDTAQWRASAPIAAHQTSRFDIRLRGNQVSLSAAQPPPPKPRP